MVRRAREFSAQDTVSLYDALVDEVKRIHEEDIALCEGIGVHGLPLIKEGSGVLTHCQCGRARDHRDRHGDRADLCGASREHRVQGLRG